MKVKKKIESSEELLLSKEILTTEDVSRLYCISISRIYQLCSQRKIPHSKRGKLYFKRSEVEAWLMGNRGAST